MFIKRKLVKYIIIHIYVKISMQPRLQKSCIQWHLWKFNMQLHEFTRSESNRFLLCLKKISVFRLIHVNVWQKSPQYCKVISLQLQFFLKFCFHIWKSIKQNTVLSEEITSYFFTNTALCFCNFEKVFKFWLFEFLWLGRCVY